MNVFTSCFSSVQPNKEKMSSSIAISKNRNHLHALDAQTVDFRKTASHLKLISSKYQRTLGNWERNAGKKHPHHTAGHGSTITSPGASSQTGDVSLTDQQNELWTGEISFGGQKFQIDFDTGSSDTLVNAGAYKPGKTSTKTDKTFSTAYGDGTRAQGTVYLDTLEIGGLPAVKDVAIGLSTTTFINSGSEGGSQGISGMAYPSLATFGSKYPPYFDSLMKAGVLKQDLFSFVLSDAGSELTLGAISSKASGEPHWVPVDSSQGFWTLEQTSVGGISINAIGDTGTTLIVGSPDQVNQLFSSLEGVTAQQESGATYGVLTGNTIPKITFTLNGKSVTLSDESAVFGTDDQGNKVLSIVGQDIGLDGWILGDAFLRNFVSVWDRGQNRFGVADLAAAK